MNLFGVIMDEEMKTVATIVFGIMLVCFGIVIAPLLY